MAEEVVEKNWMEMKNMIHLIFLSDCSRYFPAVDLKGATQYHQAVKQFPSSMHKELPRQTIPLLKSFQCIRLLSASCLQIIYDEKVGRK